MNLESVETALSQTLFEVNFSRDDTLIYKPGYQRSDQEFPSFFTLKINTIIIYHHDNFASLQTPSITS